MKVERFSGPGSTSNRRAFWNAIADIIEHCTKREGKNVSVNVQPGYGSIISINPQRGSGVGACCVDGVCSITTPRDCADAGGNFLGVGSICEGVDCTLGACCGNDGTEGSDCTLTTREGCSGVFHGYGTTCDPNPCGGPPPGETGACCIDGGCSILTAEQCAAIGGDYQGNGTMCGSSGPCGPNENCCLLLHPTGCPVPPGGCIYTTRTRIFSGDYRSVTPSVGGDTVVHTYFSGIRVLVFTSGCTTANCYVVGSITTDYTFPSDPPQSCTAPFVTCGYSPSRWAQQVAQCGWDSSGCGIYGIDDGGLDFSSAISCDGPNGTQTWNAHTDDGHGLTKDWSATASDYLT